MFMGYLTMCSTTARYNTGIGNSALFGNTSGQGNIMGQDSLASSQTKNNSVSIGYQSQFSSNHVDTSGNVVLDTH